MSPATSSAAMLARPQTIATLAPWGSLGPPADASDPCSGRSASAGEAGVAGLWEVFRYAGPAQRAGLGMQRQGNQRLYEERQRGEDFTEEVRLERRGRRLVDAEVKAKADGKEPDQAAGGEQIGAWPTP